MKNPKSWAEVGQLLKQNEGTSALVPYGLLPHPEVEGATRGMGISLDPYHELELEDGDRLNITRIVENGITIYHCELAAPPETHHDPISCMTHLGAALGAHIGKSPEAIKTTALMFGALVAAFADQKDKETDDGQDQQ